MLDIGYDSYNSIINLNTLALVILIYMIRVIIYTVLKIFVIITKDKFNLRDKI